MANEKEKPGFILNHDDIEAVSAMLNYEQIGILVTALYQYSARGELDEDLETVMDSATMMAFRLMGNKIKKDSDAWKEAQRKRSAAGTTAANARWNNEREASSDADDVPDAEVCDVCESHETHNADANRSIGKERKGRENKGSHSKGKERACARETHSIGFRTGGGTRDAPNPALDYSQRNDDLNNVILDL